MPRSRMCRFRGARNAAGARPAKSLGALPQARSGGSPALMQQALRAGVALPALATPRPAVRTDGAFSLPNPGSSRRRRQIGVF